MMEWLIIGTLSILVLVLTAMIWRSAMEIRNLRRKLDDFRIHEWDLADASESQKSITRHDLKGFFNRIEALSKLIRMSEGVLSKDQEEQLDMIEKQCQEGKAETDRMLPKED